MRNLGSTEEASQSGNSAHSAPGHLDVNGKLCAVCAVALDEVNEAENPRSKKDAKDKVCLLVLLKHMLAV